MYGQDSYKSKIELDALEDPVLLGKDVIYEKEEEKYLGNVLISLGLSASVRATTKDRTGKIKGSCIAPSLLGGDRQEDRGKAQRPARPV